MAGTVIRPAYKPQGTLHSVKGEGLAVRVIVEDNRLDCTAGDGVTSKAFAMYNQTCIPEAKNSFYIRCEPGGRDAFEKGLRRALHNCGYAVSDDSPVLCRVELQTFQAVYSGVTMYSGLPDMQANILVSVSYEIRLGEQVLHRKQTYDSQSGKSSASSSIFNVIERLLSRSMSVVVERIASDTDLAEACRIAKRR